MTTRSLQAEPQRAFRSRSQAVWLWVILFVYCALGADALARGAHRNGFGPVDIGFVAFLVVWALLTIRASFAFVLITTEGVKVRNPTQTYFVAWNDIAKIEIGRAGLLGCVCVIRKTDGSKKSAFGIQGITGQPRRTASIKAREMIAQLEQHRAATAATPG
jgi:hypothetical protein